MTVSPWQSAVQACRVSIGGTVQGVGFRPFVYRLALQHGVAGWVLNDASGVAIHVEAASERLAGFLEALRSGPPPAARITRFEVNQVDPQRLADFQILPSHREHAPSVRISPDLAVCQDCLREINDPSDRRFGYPYINCTHCGPRYSIVLRLPYDRAQTTMAGWHLCPSCQREYEDPRDRRYHAQPVACAACGPGYRLVVENGRAEVVHDDAIRRAADLLRAGAILAVKGIGGFHLACDAQSPVAVDALRTRKFRKEKPFAIMVRNLEQARTLVELSPAHERLLMDVARPIVLARAKVELVGVAPDTRLLGVMLPYTPLHHLLFAYQAPSPLVLTSANRSSEPIAYRDEDALDRLSGIADAFLIGERPIARRVDDSVVGMRTGQQFMIRRARGYAPGAVATLPTDEAILALGGDLKNTVALVVDGQVFVSQHIGDLQDEETRRAFDETVNDLLKMYEVRPERLTVVHDLHPEFYSTRFAQSLTCARRVAAQHHQAHIASVLAEHELLDEPVVGVALDGTGYGTDGAIWGCEFFIGSVRAGFERVLSLGEVSMPGGDAAARFPVQAAAGFLAELTDFPDLARAPFGFPRRYFDACALVAKKVRCFRCTSAGRLFDAVAALVGFTREATFEGQAAIWLENQARQSAPQPAYDFTDLEPGPLLRAIVADRLAGRPPAAIAYAFHAALAEQICRQVRRLCQRHQLNTAAFSGGVFQNDLLSELMLKQFDEPNAPRIITNRNVPVNDGGICLGQAALAMRSSSVVSNGRFGEDVE